MIRTVELLRILNVALAVLAAVGFFTRVNDVWARISAGGRVLRLGILALILTVAYGSIENYVQGSPPGIRVPLITASCLLILGGLWVSRHDRTQPLS